MTMATQAERPGAITFKGGPMTLVGKELQVGDKLPEFHLQAAGTLATVGWNELSENGTKAVLMILVPSIDTSVCSLETGKFNRHVANLPSDKIKTVSISADTPFAQARWAKQEDVDQYPDAFRPQGPHVRRSRQERRSKNWGCWRGRSTWRTKTASSVTFRLSRKSRASRITTPFWPPRGNWWDRKRNSGWRHLRPLF